MWYKYFYDKYSMIKTANEYWVSGDGDVEFADGDIGDSNHASLVIDAILAQYEIDAERTEIEQIENADWLRSQGLSEEEISCVLMFSDPREYAVENWGWARIQGEHAQVYNVSNNIISNLASAWYDIYGGNEETLNDMTFNIQVDNPNSRTSYYSDIPWHVLDEISDTGNLMLLNPYR